jgi:hypothetical protein
MAMTGITLMEIAQMMAGIGETGESLSRYIDFTFLFYCLSHEHFFDFSLQFFIF